MIDPTPSGRNPITGATPTSGPMPAVEPQTRLQRLAFRMRHVYRTRVRTTTVVLCALWVGLFAFYGFSTNHYDPPTGTTNGVTRIQERQTPSSREAPSTTTEESTPTTTEETSTTTEDVPTGEQSSPRRSAPAQTPFSTVPSADMGGESATPESGTGG